MKLFLFLFRASRVLFALAFAAGVVSGLSSVGLIAVVDHALRQAPASRAALGLGFAALCLIRLLTGFASQVWLVRLAERGILNARLRLSRQILAAPLRQLEEIGAARLLAALTDDVAAITNAFIIVPIVCVNAVVVVGCLIYIGWLSPSVLVAALTLMAVGIATYRIPIRLAIHHFQRARESTDALYECFRALTAGAKELKLHFHRGQKFFAESLEPTALALQSHSVNGGTIYAAAARYGNTLFFAFIGLILFALPGLNMVGAGALVGVTLAVLFLMAPLEGIMIALPVLGRAGVSLKKIEALGLSLSVRPDESPSESEDFVPPVPNAAWRRLELIGVTHSYHRENDDGSFTLGPLDLAFGQGELVFLIGGNGSGKTTLAKLLTGLYAPEAGEIRLDGQKIDDRGRVAYRQYFSAVFSDFYLFESLIGLQSPTSDALAGEYLRRLQLDAKVRVSEGRLSTTDLSQGQRKRLALLVAYLEDRPIYLFDEWAADQDPFFKDVFYLRLLPELKARGKTVIVISHNERYHHIADRIIKLDYGRIEYDRPNLTAELTANP
jgi:putative ATP-binding cassette transporter